MSEISERFRRDFAASDDRRDAGLTTPPGIRRYDDLVYGTDPHWQRLDVYRPADAEGKLPVIVSFHGGAWVYGDKERYQYYCMDLAGRGFAVVNFTYRLAPEFRFPAPLEDANLVFRWVLAHAEEYGLDTDRLFAVGDSAGAMGIMLYTCILTNPAYAAQFAFTPPEGLRIRGLALNCGLYSTASPLPTQDDLLASPEQLPLLNAIGWVTEAFPPSYILTANEDFLREEPKSLIPVLERCGVPYRYQCCGDAAHPLGHVFHCDIRSAAAIAVNDAECAFFRGLDLS